MRGAEGRSFKSLKLAAAPRGLGVQLDWFLTVWPLQASVCLIWKMGVVSGTWLVGRCEVKGGDTENVLRRRLGILET